VRDGPTDWQSCRHDRGRSDDLGRAEREVQVLRVLPGLAEDPLQDMGVIVGDLNQPKANRAAWRAEPQLLHERAPHL
jgi:hypothetical protein